MSTLNGQPRPSIAEINSAPQVRRGYTPITGDGATVPIAYGRVSMSGLIFAQVVSSGTLYLGVAWCLGVIDAVEKLYINGAALPSGVEVTHYKGTTTQGVDPWLEAEISGYEDTMVFSLPAGSIGVAYSVLKITSGTFSGVPRVQGIIRGKLVTDPNAAENSDPYYSENVIDVDFQSGGTDQSQYAHTITLSGGATVDSGGLQLSSV